MRNTALMLFWIWQCVVCAASMRGACVFFAFAGWDETFGNFENQNNARSLLLLGKVLKIDGGSNDDWLIWLGKSLGYRCGCCLPRLPVSVPFSLWHDSFSVVVFQEAKVTSRACQPLFQQCRIEVHALCLVRLHCLTTVYGCELQYGQIVICA